MKIYGREYEQRLLNDIIREHGMLSDAQIIDGLLGYFSSDDTCAALESICKDYDLPYDGEDEDDYY